MSILFPGKLVGLLDKNYDPISTENETTTITGDIISMDELENYMIEKRGEDSYFLAIFIPVLEYDESFVGEAPSFTNIRIVMFNDKMYVSDLSGNSTNIAATKDEVTYLIGVPINNQQQNPGQ